MRAAGIALPAGIAILGPTGSGKSALALRLAAQLPVEIISVDSAQVYRGLDIGTAKPAPSERAAVVHHLIDIRDPEEVYSAGEFRVDCLALIQAIAARGRLPLLVGGTMLYYRALFQGIAQMPAAHGDVRAAIDARAAREGWPGLHAELATHDPDSAARIHPNDAQRIQRALEILTVSGTTRSAHWGAAEQAYDFSAWRIAVLQPADRGRLHALLEQRLAAMLQAGFATEVASLVARVGIDRQAPALRLVGYRQLLEYALGNETLADAATRALAATRQLAKRQLTWLRAGNLLPNSGIVLRADPFDAREIKRISQHLIEGLMTP
ncbi:MAG: tRNA (adenosine(37)-N6)-dimethylallyltransferase MiaA [Steroidobacteraceae bacterium]